MMALKTFDEEMMNEGERFVTSPKPSESELQSRMNILHPKEIIPFMMGVRRAIENDTMHYSWNREFMRTD